MRHALRSLRSSALAAHVGPLLIFSVFTALPGWLRIDNPELPWHQRGPEHWVYPIQIAVCAGLLALWWRHYTFRPWRGLPLAVLLGIIGIGIWVAPNVFFRSAGIEAEHPPVWWPWLGIIDRPAGFDPTLLNDHPGWETLSVVLRFVRMVIIVPLVEEVFWRGFLMRYVVAETRHGSWQEVPFGTHHWLAFAVTTAGVTFIHDRADWPAALLWGSLMYLLAVKSKSLGACVVMHAIANLLLGIYVMQTRQWGFW